MTATAPESSHHHHHELPTKGRALDAVALSATLHCLTGCAMPAGSLAGAMRRGGGARRLNGGLVRLGSGPPRIDRWIAVPERDQSTARVRGRRCGWLPRLPTQPPLTFAGAQERSATR